LTCNCCHLDSIIPSDDVDIGWRRLENPCKTGNPVEKKVGIMAKKKTWKCIL